MSLRTISRFLRAGPGGMKCPCCYPIKGTKARRRKVRAAHRRLGKEVLRSQLQAE